MALINGKTSDCDLIKAQEMAIEPSNMVIALHWTYAGMELVIPFMFLIPRRNTVFPIVCVATAFESHAYMEGTNRS
jgi:hypothetical protein